MSATPPPIVFSAMTPGLRKHQYISLAITLIITLWCGAMVCQEWHTSEFAPNLATTVMFIIVALVHWLCIRGYEISFVIDGAQGQIVRIRRWFGWKWLRIYPAADFHTVEKYSMNPGSVAGYYLQLVGDKRRLRMVYCPTGTGMRELALDIATNLGIPYLHDDIVCCECGGPFTTEAERYAGFCGRCPATDVWGNCRMWAVIVLTMSGILGIAILLVYLLSPYLLVLV